MFRFILLTQLFVSAAVFSKTYTHTIWEIPYPDIETCQKEAIAVADRIHKEAGVETKNPRCEREESIPVVTLSVDYESAEPLNFFSTTPTVKVFFEGFYPSEKSCLEAKPAQEAIFETETGRKPIISYCYAISSTFKNHYDLKIEAVGTPKRYPFVQNFLTETSYVVANPEALYPKAAEFFAKRMARLIYLTFTQNLSARQVNFFYYAEKDLQLKQEVFTELPDVATCESELKAMEAKFSTLPIAAPLAYCVSRTNPSYPHAHLFLYTEEGLMKRVSSFEAFPSYAACAAQKEAVMKKYQGVYGDKLAVGVCQMNLIESRYHVAMLVTK